MKKDSVKIITIGGGLCNVPVNMVAGFAKMLGVEEKDVTMEIQGVNHFIFATDVFVNGESRFQELLDLVIIRIIQNEIS